MMWRLLPMFFVPVLLCAGPARVISAPVPGDRMAPFCLPSSEGGTMTWAPGRVTVLTFCAFWCDTWKDQSKRLADVQQAVKGLPVDFVTVSIDGRWSELGKGKFTGSLLLDPGRKLSGRLGIDRIPYTIILNTDGRVFFAVQGVISSQATAKSIVDCVAGEKAGGAKVMYLTFDDFPCPAQGPSTTPSSELDERLLAILRKLCAPATFFCVCGRLKSNKDIVESAVRDGHSLQVHSWEHDAADPRIKQCVREMAAITGRKPSLYRPPGSEKCLVIDGGEITLPVVNPYDYTRPGVQELKRRILLAAKPNCVILLHAGVSDTVEALPALITSLRDRGFEFGRLPAEGTSVSNAEPHAVSRRLGRKETTAI